IVSSQLVVEMSTPSSRVSTGSIELTMLPSSGPANAPTATPANALYAAIRPDRGSDSVGAGGLVGRTSWISATTSIVADSGISLASASASPEQRVDLADQPWQLDGLRIIVVAAGLQRPLAVAAHGVGRQRDDRDAAG